MSALIRTLYVVSFLFGVLTLTHSDSQTVSNLPKRGTVAPEFEVRNINDTRDGDQISLAKLRGKVVVVEFWATWCAPCLEEIPKVNALVKALKPGQVQFVSVTDENPAVVRTFLQRHPMLGSVVVDSSRSVFDRYGVVARPATIVIDPQGRIVSNDIAPDKLSRAQLRALSDGHASALRATRIDSVQASGTKPQTHSSKRRADEQENGASQTLVSIKIAEGRPGTPHLSMYGRNYFELNSAPIRELVGYALGYSVKRITLNDRDLEKKTFDLSVHAAGIPDNRLKGAVAATIESAIGAKIEHQVHDEDVLVLEELSTLSTSKSDGGVAGFDPKRRLLVMINASASQIASASEDALGKPVINEIAGNAGCTGSIIMSVPDEDALRAALTEKCGIASRTDKRSVDRISITPDRP